MPRNGSGTYSTPAGQPVTSGTVISSTVFNALVNDLKTEMTDSLSRSGKGGMLVPLPFANGTVSAPSISFQNETGSGWYRAGAGDLRFAKLGVDAIKVSATRVGFVTGGVGEQVSTSTGTFSTTSGSLVDVTNATVTITTTGRPVMLVVQGDGTTTPTIGPPANQTSNLHILRGAGAIFYHTYPSLTVPVRYYSLIGIDVVAAGTYTYKLQASVTGGATFDVKNVVLIAYEL